MKSDRETAKLLTYSGTASINATYIQLGAMYI